MSPLTFIIWLALIAGAGWTAFPLARRIFKADLPDAGWAVGRILFLASWTMLAFWLGQFGVSVAQCAWLYAPLAMLGIYVGWRDRDALKEVWRRQRRAIIATEAIFVAVFLGFFLLRGFWSDTSGDNGEKGMDSALIAATVRAQKLPPPNPYAAGARVGSYYYFGPLQTALLTRAAGTQMRWSYNLMCATLPALCFAALFSLGAALTGTLRGGAWVTVAVLCGGALQPIYQWSHPDAYSAGRLFGLDPFAVSRVLPYTINEFPWFTLHQGDLHGHLFDFPFQIALMTLGWSLLRAKRPINAALAALLCGATILTNTWDFPAFTLLVGLAILIIVPASSNVAHGDLSYGNATKSGAVNDNNDNATNGNLMSQNGIDDSETGGDAASQNATDEGAGNSDATSSATDSNASDSVSSTARTRGVPAAIPLLVGRIALAAGVIGLALLVASPFLLHLQSAANPPQFLRQPASPLREWLMMWAPIALCWWAFAALVIFERAAVWRVTLFLMGAGIGVAALFHPWQAPSVLVLPIIAASVGFAIAGLFAPRKSVRYVCVLALCGLCALAWSELTWAGFLGNAEYKGIDDFKRQDTVFKFGLQVWMLWGTAAAAGLWLAMQRAARPVRRAAVMVLAPLAIVMLAGNLSFMLHRVRFMAMWEAQREGSAGWFQFDAWDAWAHLAPPEKAAADWLERNAKTGENIVEAEARENGDFSIYTRYAAATGIPTVVGPPAHTFYWAPADAPLGRGEDARKVKSAAESDEVSRRKANVRLIYSPIPAVQRARILNDYNVKWVMWGELERRRYGEPMWPDIATGLPIAAQFGAPDDPHRVTILQAN